MNSNVAPLRVVVIGFGRMGRRHVEVYADSPNFLLTGICGRDRQRSEIESRFRNAAFYTDLDKAIANESPDLVCISTHVESHDRLTRLALENGCHVFLEKPVTADVVESRALLKFSKAKQKKLIVGHILHHDRLWIEFINACHALSGPIEIKIHLDQHSSGEKWDIHKRILQNSTIASDCAIHFFDIMSQAINAQLRTVVASSFRTHDIKLINDNYLSAMVEFSDGSKGTYKSGWGPGFESPAVTKICAVGGDESILVEELNDQTKIIKLHSDGTEQIIYSELSHLENATQAQQEFVYRAINEDLDLEFHHQRTLACMEVAEAADRSIAESEAMTLNIQ